MGDVISLEDWLRVGLSTMPQPPAFCNCTIPGEPVPKARARARRGQRAYTPARTVQATDAVAKSLLAARQGPPARHAKVQLELEFWRSSSRRCDLDNLIKLVMDAANGVLWADDDQVIEVHAFKSIDRSDPRTVVRAYRVDVEAVVRD